MLPTSTLVISLGVKERVVALKKKVYSNLMWLLIIGAGFLSKELSIAFVLCICQVLCDCACIDYAFILFVFKCVSVCVCVGRGGASVHQLLFFCAFVKCHVILCVH